MLADIFVAFAAAWVVVFNALMIYFCTVEVRNSSRRFSLRGLLLLTSLVSIVLAILVTLSRS